MNEFVIFIAASFSLIIHCELRCLARPSPYARKVSIAPQPLRLLAYKSYEKGIGADVTIHAGGNIFRVCLFNMNVTLLF